MNKTRTSFLLLAVVYSVTACTQEALPQMSKDSTYVTIMVNGKRMTVPLQSRSESGLFYFTDKPFVQNDTIFLYREYSYYQCDTCSSYQLDSSSYYVRTKSWKGYLQNLHSYTYWMQGAEGTDEYYDEAYKYLRKKCPLLHHQQLGTMPRLWYPVVRYRGKYYISIDNLNAIELTDSIVVYHDMEISMSALLNFKEEGKGCYRWQEQNEYFEGINTITIHPAKTVKGLYVMTTVCKELGITVHQLVTPERDIHRFDFIDWRSSDHIPEGLEYDAVDFGSL